MNNSFLAKNQIFIVCESHDVDVVVQLQIALKNSDVKVWSMFKDNGQYSMGLGKDHLEEAYKEMLKSTMFVILVSENSILKNKSTDFITQEIQKIKTIEKEFDGILTMPIIPITVGKTSFEDFPENWRSQGLSANKISLNLKTKTNYDTNKVEADSKSLEVVVNDLTKQYYKTIMKNNESINSRKYSLVKLASECLQNYDTTIKTVSDDIRDSVENDIFSLKEMHIISDEITEYDMNPYSLMIIASNLMGPRKNGEYNPEKNGARYYYYCSTEDDYCGRTSKEFTKWACKFLKKEKDAIELVDKCIRKHFVNREDLILYFRKKLWEGSVEKFLSQFLLDEDDQEELQEFIEEFDDGNLLTYSEDEEEVFNIPTEFFHWLAGLKYQKPEKVRKFIRFISELTNKMADVAPKSARLTALEKVSKDLKDLLMFSDSILGKDTNLPKKKLSTLTRKILGPSSSNQLIENWLNEEFLIEDMESYVEQAMKNITFIPVTPSEDYIISNSFAIFVHNEHEGAERLTKTSAWYTCAHNGVQKGNTIDNFEQETLMIGLNMDEDMTRTKVIPAFKNIFDLKLAKPSYVQSSKLFIWREK